MSGGLDEVLHYVEDRILQLETELRILRQVREILLSAQAEPPVEPSEEDLNNLGWRPYPSGRGEWVYADEAPQALVERLRREGRGIVIGGYLYRLRSGATGKTFVSRRPIERGATK